MVDVERERELECDAGRYGGAATNTETRILKLCYLRSVEVDSETWTLASGLSLSRWRNGDVDSGVWTLEMAKRRRGLWRLDSRDGEMETWTLALIRMLWCLDSRDGETETCTTEYSMSRRRTRNGNVDSVVFTLDTSNSIRPPSHLHISQTHI